MATWKTCLYIFRAAEVVPLAILSFISPKLALDLFWAFAYSPYGIALLMKHGHSPKMATVCGMLGGSLSVFNLWLIAYYDFERSPVIRNLIEKLWHFSPAKSEHSGLAWKLPYPFVFAVSIWDVWFALATAKFFRLNKWIILGLTISVSAAKGFASGKTLVALRGLNPFVAKNLQNFLLGAFIVFVSISLCKIIKRKIEFSPTPLQ